MELVNRYIFNKTVVFSDTISTAILRWVYCDVIDLDQGDDILLDLLRASSYFQLTPLAER